MYKESIAKLYVKMVLQSMEMTEIINMVLETYSAQKEAQEYLGY